MYQLQKVSRWPKRLLWLGGILVALLVVLGLIGIGYAHLWTGFGQHKVKVGVQPAKTLWDWLDLLVVPLVLAVGGYLFTRSETQATQAAAERRAQDEALQAYLDVMSQLLTDKTQPLSNATLGDHVSTLARARTLTALPRLDGDRKGQVVQFLYESELITKDNVVVDLRGADLRGATLILANLDGASLGETFLHGAQLYLAELEGADLNNALLPQADLRKATLDEADLSYAHLPGADLTDAFLSGTRLQGANLTRANLTNTNLDAINSMTTILYLQQATMPNGQKYEDWLKDKESHGEDG